MRIDVYYKNNRYKEAYFFVNTRFVGRKNHEDYADVLSSNCLPECQPDSFDPMDGDLASKISQALIEIYRKGEANSDKRYL